MGGAERHCSAPSKSTVVALATSTSNKENKMLLGEILGPDMLIVVIIVAVLIFGGAAIPKFARNLGQAKNEFEKGFSSTKDTEVKTPSTDS
jgi:TatA/E family protein of Tat protein translocase